MNPKETEHAIIDLRLRMARVEHAVKSIEQRIGAADTPIAPHFSEAEVCPELYLRDESPESQIVAIAEPVKAALESEAPAVADIPIQDEVGVIHAIDEVPLVSAAAMPRMETQSFESESCEREEAPVPSAWNEIQGSAKAKAKSESRRSLELLIGMNWMAWAGALLVVLATAFFVKLAYDNDWFGVLTEKGKCILAAAFGAALIGAGEYALRRINRIAAASLYGAGLGVLYLTAFATFQWFDLLSETGAFWLLLFVAMLGFAISVRARLITTAVLATLGGYLTPILLRNAESEPWALPLYLTMLLTLSLGLSAWQERPFRALRYVALTCHLIIAGLWIQAVGAERWLMALSFMAIWWCEINGESIVAALRGQSAMGNPIASLAITAWIMFHGHQLISDVQPNDREYLGLFAACLSAMAAIPAVLVGPGIKMLQHRPKRAVEKLGVALWAQAGVLLATAIGFQFDGFGQTIGWLVLGYACVEVGRKLPSRGVDLFGLGVGALALARVALLDSTLDSLRQVYFQYGDLEVTYWGLLAAGAVATVYLSAIRLQCLGTPPRVKLPIFLMGLGTFGWAVICVTQAEGLVVSWGWLAAAVVLLASYHVGRRHRCFFFGRMLLGLTALKWIVLDGSLQQLQQLRTGATILPVINLGFAAALLIAAGMGFVAWIRYRREQAGITGRIRWPHSVNIGIVFLLITLSFQLQYGLELAKTRGWTPIWPPELLVPLSLTVMWAICGAIVIFAARQTRVPALHMMGWTLVVLCGVSWLSFETLVWRAEHKPIATPPLANLQAAVGILLLVLTAYITWREQRTTIAELGEAKDKLVRRAVGWAIVAALGLWLGSLEIDRYCGLPTTNTAGAAMARQTGFSIWWGLYAIVLLAIGFVKRTPAVRYAGLGLLTITLGKVLIVDMKQVEYVYRVLSFLAVGLLLMGTSVAYAKLSRRLGGEGTSSGARADEGLTADE